MKKIALYLLRKHIVKCLRYHRGMHWSKVNEVLQALGLDQIKEVADVIRKDDQGKNKVWKDKIFYNDGQTQLVDQVRVIPTKKYR